MVYSDIWNILEARQWALTYYDANAANTTAWVSAGQGLADMG